MSKRFAAFSLIAAAVGALPGAAAAADLYGYGEEAPAYHGRVHPGYDGGYREDDLGPGRYRARPAPGPVVFDERGGRAGGAFADGPRPGPGYGPGPAFGEVGPAYGPPRGFGPAYGPPRGFGPGYGEAYRPAPFYRPAAVAVVPVDGAGFGAPEAGCTVERARSITPAGWQKTVTHRTCYSR